MKTVIRGMGVLVAVVGLVIGVAACASESKPTTQPTPTPTAETEELSGFSGFFGFARYGLASLEEHILSSHVIVRAKMRSVVQKAEKDDWHSFYRPALEYTFDVLEYLKGSGGSQLKAIADSSEEAFSTEAEASAKGADLLSTRTTRWDDREAILFIQRTSRLPRTMTGDVYWLSYERYDGSDDYTIANDNWRAWLPAATSPESTGIGQRFLLEEPQSSTGDSASGSSQVSPATVTLPALKALITRLEGEIDALVALGHGFPREDYEWCLGVKYNEERKVRQRNATGGAHPYFREDLTLDSGSAAGTSVYRSSLADIATWYDPKTPDPNGQMDWLGGRDATLFTAKKGAVKTVRPLPAGEYRFFHNPTLRLFLICDSLPKEEKEKFEYFLTVTAPSGTVHEAFFDPIAIDSTVGADASNGVLKPHDFYLGDASSSITGLGWEDGKVTLALSPYVSLAGKSLDFIELDGTVGLSLGFDDGVSDGESGTVEWGVDGRPWESGDELMIRIR